MTELAGELSPGADVRDLVAASGQVTEALKAGDAEGVVVGTATMGAAFAGIFVPGSVGGGKRVVTRLGEQKRKFQSSADLSSEIRKNWPDAKRVGAREANNAFRESWRKRRTRDTRNLMSAFKKRPFHPPYDMNYPTYMVTAKDEVQFVRVMPKDSKDMPIGRWLMRREDYDVIMKGPNPANALREYLALPTMPVAASEVRLPAGTKLRIGIASPHQKWGRGGGVQIEILDALDIDWFDEATLFSGGKQ